LIRKKNTDTRQGLLYRRENTLKQPGKRRGYSSPGGEEGKTKGERGEGQQDEERKGELPHLALAITRRIYVFINVTKLVDIWEEKTGPGGGSLAVKD